MDRTAFKDGKLSRDSNSNEILNKHKVIFETIRKILFNLFFHIVESAVANCNWLIMIAGWRDLPLS